VTVAVRPGTPADHDAYLRLFAELGVPDPPPSADAFAQRIAPTLRVACDSEDVVGYATWRAYGATAHVMQLVVRSSLRGRRIGELLLERVRGEAREAGCERWYLNVKRGNAPAIKLYTRCGFTHELDSWSMKIDRARVPPIGEPQPLLRLDEDAEAAARFGMPVERLASFRARGNYKLVALREGGEVVGLAAFDPGFPGAAAFCATRPELARALLDAVRHHADPSFDFVRVTVEGDRALADAVVALGGAIDLELVRLAAPLA